MKTVLKVLLGLIAVFVLAIAAFVIVVAMQGEDFMVTRSITMNAPPSEAFEQVNDFRKWNDWSPWAKLDPAMKVTYAGPASGVGSSYTWAGNDEVGHGKMTITESEPPRKIMTSVEFVEPFPSTANGEFSFTPEGDKTNVAWKMSMKKNFAMKAMCLVMDMDKMLGADFEKGLAQMKAVVEAN